MPLTMVWPGKREAEFGPDDMDDALARVEHRDIGHAEVGDVGVERLDLQARTALGDAAAAIAGRNVVIDTASVASGRRTLRPACRKPSKACGLCTSSRRWRSM